MQMQGAMYDGPCSSLCILVYIVHVLQKLSILKLLTCCWVCLAQGQYDLLLYYINLNEIMCYLLKFSELGMGLSYLLLTAFNIITWAFLVA